MNRRSSQPSRDISRRRRQAAWFAIAPTLVAWLATQAAGCTLAFDTDLPFEDDDMLVVNNPTNNTNNPEPGLGMPCGADVARLCRPDIDGTACAHRQCEDELGPGAMCAMGFGLYGYCTRPCTTDDQCAVAGSPFLEAMRCTKTEGASYCLPGSRKVCGSDLDCNGGELCKVVELEVGNRASVAPRCEPATPFGAAAGEFCNDDPFRGPIKLCANGVCPDDTCTPLCPSDGSSPSDNYCASPLFVCRSQQDTLENLGGAGRCAGVPCSSSAECNALAPEGGAYCSPSLVARRPGEGLRGGCRKDQLGDNRDIALGDLCLRPDSQIDPSYCASRYCLGVEPDLRCSTICDVDADCAENQFCAVTALGTPEERVFAKLCRYAVGEATFCLGTSDCVPGEICAPYIFGDVTDDGAQVIDPHLEGHCIKAQSGGVPRGTSCEELPCAVPGACISYRDGTYLCSSVCDPTNFEDCPFGFVCGNLVYLGSEYVTDGVDRTLSFCVRVEF